MASTPLRNVRIDDDLWNAAVDRAVREGRSISGVIRDLLRAYAAIDNATRSPR